MAPPEPCPPVPVVEAGVVSPQLARMSGVRIPHPSVTTLTTAAATLFILRSTIDAAGHSLESVSVGVFTDTAAHLSALITRRSGLITRARSRAGAT
jgi:hypothetical protein